MVFGDVEIDDRVLDAMLEAGFHKLDGDSGVSAYVSESHTAVEFTLEFTMEYSFGLDLLKLTGLMAQAGCSEPYLELGATPKYRCSCCGVEGAEIDVELSWSVLKENECSTDLFDS